MTKEAFEKLLQQNEIYLKSSKTKTSHSQIKTVAGELKIMEQTIS